MVKRVLGILTVLFVALAASTVAPAADGVVLKYTHSAGDRAVYDYGLSARLQLKEEGGQSARVEMSLQMKCLAQYLGDTSSGDWGILGHIVSGTAEAKSEDQEQSVEIGEVKVRYIVSPTGEIQSHRLVSGDPPVLNFGGAVLVLGPDDAFMLAGVAIFPDQPLKKGESWTGTATVPNLLEGDSQEVPFKSVFLGESTFAGSKCYQIKTASTHSFEGSIPSPDGSGALDVVMTAVGEATWLFDPARGVIVSIEGRDNVKTVITMTQTGQKLGTITSAGVVNTKSVLKEFNGKAVSAP